MLVWSILSQKGGSGKTTLVLHLAIAAVGKNLLTSVVDLDPQKSAEKWSELREEHAGRNEPVIVHGTTDNLDEMLAAARAHKTDLVLIDTPPVADKTMIFAAAAADVIIVPTRASVLDRFALEDTLKLLQAASLLERCVVLVNAPRTARDQGLAEVRALAKSYGVGVSSSEIANLSQLSTMLDKGLGAAEGSAKSAAAKTIEVLFRYLQARGGKAKTTRTTRSRKVER